MSVQPSPPPNAVFISYASQDVDAARRICSALRASGVEVWFDQNELRGGDAWDAKIRKQVRECGLFVPIISAHTQARLEGYFRLEWKLAAHRTHTMAAARAFLLPVVIDATRDSEAHVPEEFLSVQWTRLSEGESPADFVSVVKRKLLEAAGTSTSPFARDATMRRGRGRGWPWLALGIGFALATIGGGIGWQTWQSRGVRTADREVTAMIKRAYSLFERVDYTRADLDAAEVILRGATDFAPDSAKAWGARAYVHACYFLRRWETSDQVRRETEDWANRALALDADDTEAMLAIALILNSQKGYPRAEGLLRRAMLRRSDDPRFPRALVRVINGQGRMAEGLALQRETAQRFPRDPLAQYDLAAALLAVGDYDGALATCDATIAIQPFSNVLMLKTGLLMTRKGDLRAARAAFEKLPIERRGEDRAIGVGIRLALLERQATRVHQAIALSTRVYLDEAVVRGPTAFGEALAYQLEGKDALAQAAWRKAEHVVREHMRQFPNAPGDTARLAIAIAWQGRGAEAAALIAPVENAANESGDLAELLLVAQFYGACGDVSRTMPYLRRVNNYGGGVVTDHTLPVDPWWDKLRGDPAFEEYLTEITRTGRKAVMKLSEPSVSR
jgi:tetratricopeptide (TPR) repeat protein